MSEQFKAGDEVYCPQMGKLVYMLDEIPHNPIYFYLAGFASLDVNGKVSPRHNVPAIFHATPENKALLEALYKCEFESPKLKGSDLTRKLLSDGKHVLCYVRNDSEGDCADKIEIVTELFEDVFLTLRRQSYKYAVPCNDYANLADGVLIKSEQ